MIFPLKELNDKIQSIDAKNRIISIWGEHGVGKTTFSLQTAFYNCAISNFVIFVYTKPNLPLILVKRISLKFNEKNLNDFTLYKSLNFSELFDFILDLEHLIIKLREDRKEIKILIIIDSLTNLYQIELRKGSKSKNIILNYKLNQILGTLNYLKLLYPVDVLIVNNISRIKQDNQAIEVQSGGKVMKYWVDSSVKIERDKKINHRIFLLTNPADTIEISFLSKLSKFGFE